MRAILPAVVVALALSVPAIAEESPGKDAPKTVQLVLPATTDDCIRTLESSLERALEADLLDDQIDEAEGIFEKLETACIDGRFDEALEQAKAIERLVAMNK